MPRPALIIGLGGTGQWVLTWLKRDLLLANNGKMPNHVRLLSIDTTTKLEAGASRVNASGQKEEAVELTSAVGRVALDRSEYIYLGGDSKPIAHEVSEGHYPQIKQWYQADKWLSTQNPATFILDDGAGRLRQFGRMAVFKDLLKQETGSVLWSALRSAMESVRTGTTEQRRLELIVVGSFAGGTGSGTFIDISLILRHLAQRYGIHHVLRGYFALPSVFTTAPNAEMKARAFSAWRELNRFMVVNPDFPMPNVSYVENNVDFQIHPTQRLFDACYLIDGRRKGKPLGVESKFGVFPMIAEVLSALIDEEAGTAYTQWVFTNLAPEYARRPEMPMYSAVGAYTVQVPTQYVQHASSHAHALNLLLSLLAPRNTPDKNPEGKFTGRWNVNGAVRHLALAAPDKNKEDPGFSGRSRSLDLFLKSVSVDSILSKPSPFVQRIGQILSTASDKRANILRQVAEAGAADLSSGSVSASWVAYFTDFENDTEFENIRKEVNAHMQFSIPKEYGRAEKEKEASARDNFRGISNDIRKRFGGITGEGNEKEDYYGECGEALHKCFEAQLVLFRRHLRVAVLDILMGKNANMLIARSGKLGYVYDYLDGTIKENTDFIKFLEDVRKYREEKRPELRLRGIEKRAQDFLNATTGKKIFWLWEHPNVKGAEVAYLQAQQRLMQLRREDVLHHYVALTALKMKEACEEMREAVTHWILHLSTGDASTNIAGLWGNVANSWRELDAAHAFDENVTATQLLIGNNVLETADADLEKALHHWNWVLNYEGDSKKPVLSVQISSDDPDRSPQNITDPLLDDIRLRQETARKNQSVLIALAQRRFNIEASQTSVADEIKLQFARGPKEFAEAVANISAEPLFDGNSGSNPRRKSNLIRVKTKPNDSFFNGAQGLEGELRVINQKERSTRDDIYGIQVVQSEHPYKLTLVRTDDLYDFNHFSTWKDCETAYARHMDKEGDPLDPVLMHNFSAEQRASEIERQLTRDGRDYQALHPRIVMLLENPGYLKQFLYLGILGKLQEVEDSKGFRWEVSWTKASGAQTIWLTRGWDEDRDKTHRSKPDILNAAHGYVIFRRTQQPGRRDVIDYEFVQRMLTQEMQNLGEKEHLALLNTHLDEEGFITWLQDQARDIDVPDRIIRQDLADLAIVSRVLLQEEITRLQTKSKTSGARPSNPFLTRKK